MKKTRSHFNFDKDCRNTMNDIRRTILWVVFGFSVIMLWDQWQIHNGKKPTFFPSVNPVATNVATQTPNPSDRCRSGVHAKFAFRNKQCNDPRYGICS
jgi:hypothetical protein